MEQTALGRWLGACLLGSAVAAGCHHEEPRPVYKDYTSQTYRDLYSKNAVHSTEVMSKPPPAPPGDEGKPALVTFDDGTDSHKDAIASVPAHLPSALTPVSPVAEAPVKQDAGMVLAPASGTSSSDEASVKPVVHEEKPQPTIPVEPPPHRRSYVDITAQPCFAHAPDYSWLTGQLQHFGKNWRVRFASVDEEDPYGGSVTLMEDARLESLKDGDYVRVQGRLLGHESRSIAPPYQADAIQPIDKEAAPR